MPGTSLLQTETWSEPPFPHPTPPPGKNSRGLPPERSGVAAALRGLVSRGASLARMGASSGDARTASRVEPRAQGAAGKGSQAGSLLKSVVPLGWAPVRGAEGNCFFSFEVQASLAGKREGLGTLSSSRGSCASEPVSESTRGVRGAKSLRAWSNKLGLT